MAEYGGIPAEINGTPIPDLSDVSVAQARNITQNATTGGVKQTYGLPKYTATLTFKTLKDRAAYLRQIGAYQRDPVPHNLTYVLGGSDRFTLTECLAVPTSIGSDQDGNSSLQIQISAEELIDEGA